MSGLSFHKLNQLPTVYEPNCAYLIPIDGTDQFNLYISSSDGTSIRQISNNYAPSSHVGAGGTEHSVATTTEAGFMSADDKVLLSNLMQAIDDQVEPFFLLGM